MSSGDAILVDPDDQLLWGPGDVALLSPGGGGSGAIANSTLQIAKLFSFDEDYRGNIRVANGNYDSSTNGFGRFQGTQMLGTSAVQLLTGGVTDPGWVVLQNPSSVTVSWGLSSGSTPFEIPAGLVSGIVKVETGSGIYAKVASGTGYVEITCTQR